MLGSKVQTTFKENVPEGPQASQVIDSLVRDGNKMIFATSFGYQDAMVAAAKKYPDVMFEQATGYMTVQEPGRVLRRGRGCDLPLGHGRGRCHEEGRRSDTSSRSRSPRSSVTRTRSRSACRRRTPAPPSRSCGRSRGSPPDKEKKAAESLHTSGGADVMGQNVDSPAAGQYSESVGIPWVGYDSDAKSFAPKSWLTAAVYNWGPYYLKETKAAMDGTWKTGSYWGNFNDKFIALAPFGAGVSAKTKAAITAKMAAIKKGSFYEFQGPIYDQAGKLRVPKGKKLSLNDILAMDWLVKGVVGSPKG